MAVSMLHPHMLPAAPRSLLQLPLLLLGRRCRAAAVTELLGVSCYRCTLLLLRVLLLLRDGGVRQLNCCCYTAATAAAAAAMLANIYS